MKGQVHSLSEAEQTGGDSTKGATLGTNTSEGQHTENVIQVYVNVKELINK